MSKMVTRFFVGVVGFLICFDTSAQTGQWGSLTYETVGFEVHITSASSITRGNLVIPDEIDGFPVTKIKENAFRDRSLITSIEMPDSIVEIGNAAFVECDALVSISIPPKAKIGLGLFQGCNKLTVVDWPKTITVVPFDTFKGCVGLKSIVLPLELTEIHRAAFAQSGLESIVIPDRVTTIESGAFSYCSNLKSITIPTATRSIHDNAFSGSLYLTQVRIPERYHSESEAIRIGLETAWPNGFLIQDAELTGPSESLEIRLAPVVTVRGVPGEVKTIDVSDNPDGPWKLWRIVIVATGGASEVDLDDGANKRFYRIRN